MEGANAYILESWEDGEIGTTRMEMGEEEREGLESAKS